MNQKLFNVLLVEDNLGDAFLIQEQFKSAKTFEYSIVHVDYLKKAITYLEQSPCDVILLDLSLPDSQGIETLKTIATKALQIPIVILTGTNDEGLAIQAVRQGAQDYFVKGQVMGKVLIHALHYAIERKLIEEQLKTRTYQLEALNQELEAFSYTVSHDLRNPLTVIKGMATLLKQKYDLEQRNEQEQHFLKHICDSSDRMEQIIEDLLILSQVKKSELEIKPINLSDLAREIGDRLQQQETDRQVKLTIQPQIIAIGDENLLMHALENLLHNAWKYTSEQQHPWIEVGVIDANPKEVSKKLYQTDLEAIDDLHQRNRIRAAYRNLTYFIRDNGLGFEMKSAEQLFTPFHRLQNAKKFEGTGIGLAIVQRIIHRHDGRIWAEAAEGEGATFYFTLAI
ncbi:MAG: response regulator [Hydrococcus sp. SU_1_0]|nr:response regulator [Hydrococcus sp. SU_1_0]